MGASVVGVAEDDGSVSSGAPEVSVASVSGAPVVSVLSVVSVAGDVVSSLGGATVSDSSAEPLTTLTVRQPSAGFVVPYFTLRA